MYEIRNLCHLLLDHTMIWAQSMTFCQLWKVQLSSRQSHTVSRIWSLWVRIHKKFVVSLFILLKNMLLKQDSLGLDGLYIYFCISSGPHCAVSNAVTNSYSLEFGLFYFTHTLYLHTFTFSSWVIHYFLLLPMMIFFFTYFSVFFLVPTTPFFFFYLPIKTNFF